MDLLQTMVYLTERCENVQRLSDKLDKTLDDVFRHVSKIVPEGTEIHVPPYRIRNKRTSNWNGTTRWYVTGLRIYDRNGFDWALHPGALNDGGSNLLSWSDSVAPRKMRIWAAEHLREILRKFDEKVKVKEKSLTDALGFIKEAANE